MYAEKNPNLIGFIGDVHGKMRVFEHTVSMLLNRGVTNIVQVGDFWLYDDQKMLNKLERVIKRVSPAGIDPDDIDYSFLDGNHEGYDDIDPDGDPVKLSDHVTYMPRGSVKMLAGKRVVFFGGASSTDKERRTDGKNWWPEENITESQFNRARDLRESGDILVTHETDTESFDRLCSFSNHAYGKRKDIEGVRNREYITAVKGEAPVLAHFHGHHHTAALEDSTVSLSLETAAGAVVILDVSDSTLYAPVYRRQVDDDWREDEFLAKLGE